MFNTEKFDLFVRKVRGIMTTCIIIWIMLSAIGVVYIAIWAVTTQPKINENPDETWEEGWEEFNRWINEDFDDDED